MMVGGRGADKAYEEGDKEKGRGAGQGNREGDRRSISPSGLKTDRRAAMAQHSEPMPGGLSDPMSSSGGTVVQRPGWFTFAAVIMFFVAGFEVLSTILAFGGTGWWVTEMGNLVYANFVFWGVLDLIVALIALYAGMSLLRGGAFGLVMGYLFAGLTAIRWLVVIPAAPVLSVVMIALCVMVIYGLAKHSDYGESA